MSNIFGILNTAKVSILSQQTAIAVTAQNVANANTEGYTRQVAVFEATPPLNTIPGMMGTGVQITEIKRSFDAFINSQINSETVTLGFFKAQKEILDQVEIVFNETSGGGVSKALNEFFESFQDLSINPQGLGERASVLGKANILTDVTQRLGNDLKQKRLQVDNNLLATIGKINLLTSQIAKLNEEIHQVEVGPVNANDLRDERDRKVKELADLIDIQVLEESNNQIGITTTQGRQLVLGLTSFELSVQINGDNFGLRDVMLDDGTGNLTNITSEISGGSIGGMIEVRDTFITNQIKKLDIFSAALVREVNKIHITGFGIDGSTGLNFFDPLSLTAKTNTNNTGSATLSGNAISPSSASVDEYQIRITGGSTFSLTNLTTGASSGTFTFSSGNTVNLGNGISITLTGSAQVNDIFTFSLSENSASSIAINSTLLSNSEKLAAGKTRLPGNGSNALAIAGLQNDLSFISQSLSSGSGSFTFEDFYSSILSDIGLNAKEMNDNVSQQENILTQLLNRREEISGVSLDEEMINIIKFQQAFDAAARIIATTDEMLDSIQDLVR